MYHSHIETCGILSSLFLWGPAKISTQSLDICACQNWFMTRPEQNLAHMTAELQPSLKHITPATCTASGVRCVSNREGEVVTIGCGYPCAMSLPPCQLMASRMAFLVWPPGSELSQHFRKKLLWKSARRSDCVQAASRFAARFYYFIPFDLKIFRIDSCSSTVFK